MRKQLLGLGLAFGVAALLGTSDASAVEMMGWRVQGSGAGIVEGQKYSFYNIDQGNYLGYQDRAGGNFGWDRAANNGMMVKRKDPGSGPIKCGEVVAIFIEKEWMIYGRQDYGINLTSRTKLDRDEYYQWKFSGCPSGQPVPMNGNITLTNTVANDSLVGCKRALGANICWAADVVSLRGKNYRRADVPK